MIADNQMAFQALERVLTEASGVSTPEFTQRELWMPLQFESDTFWWSEGFEWPPGSGKPGPPVHHPAFFVENTHTRNTETHTAVTADRPSLSLLSCCFPADGPIYGGMTTSCHDLARFCHLWLNRGEVRSPAIKRIYDRTFYAEIACL